MQRLEAYLQELFGGPRPGGQRLAAVGEAHAVHESGYDVSYSRYAVTYRDTRGEVVLGSEFDEDGLLVVHASRCPDATAIERIGVALRYLGVRHTFR